MHKIYIIGAALLFACSQETVAGENYFCLTSEQAVKDFDNGSIVKQPHYQRAPHGGARVQAQHPKTHMFAQAKHLVRNGTKGAICQYSNHVGLVATYYKIDVQPVKAVDICDPAKCNGSSYWRTEWINSSVKQDLVGEENIVVCVLAKDGFEYPSQNCGFEAAVYE